VAAYLFRPAMHVDGALCKVKLFTSHSARSTGIARRNKYAATISITSYNDIYLTEVNIVTLGSTGRELPDDGLCNPKHVGATIIILNNFNNLTIL